jgi:hypothetical protein
MPIPLFLVSQYFRAGSLLVGMLMVMLSLSECVMSQEISMCSNPSLETSPMPNPSNSSSSQVNRQGIQGQVVQLNGNYMPTNISPEAVDQQATNQTECVQTTVWIFSGRIPSTGSPRWPIAEAAEHPNLVGRVESDRNGYYSINLSAGEYTVFAQAGDSLYLNAFQGDGSFKSTEVVAGQFVQLDLIHTENAVF